MTLLPLATETLLDNSYRETASMFDGVYVRQVIPDHTRSPLRSDEDSLVSCGITAALFTLLTGRVQARAGDTSVQVEFPHGPGSARSVAVSGTTPGTRVWLSDAAPPRPHAAVLLALVEALRGRLPHTRAALLRLSALLAQQGLRYPVPGASLTASTGLPQIRDALCRVMDTLDAEVRLQLHDGTLTSAAPQAPDTALHPLSLARLLYPDTARARETPVQQLARLIQRGGAALLVGPPGTFKTQSAKEAAVSSGAALVIAKGSPSDEPADLLGGLYPNEAGGLIFVDGPVTRAFVQAAERPTVLLIDEVLRYPAETQAVLIGALDPLTAGELVAMGLGERGGAEESYYALALRNGDHLVCPARHLSVIMTTNLGADHHQVADRLDGALLSRIDLILELQDPDPVRARQLYERSGGRELAELAAQAEALTRDAFAQPGTPLVRCLEARKTLALIRETRSSVEAGTPLLDALTLAFEHVALPYCLGRDARGRLDAGGAEMLRQRLRQEIIDQQEPA